MDALESGKSGPERVSRPLRELLAQLALGEDDRHTHLETVSTGGALAAEVAALANGAGGTIYVGVAPDGTLPGVARSDLDRVFQVIRYAATQHVRSPLKVAVRHVRLAGGGVVVVIRVPRGPDRPHFDRYGVIWRKVGADKRRVTSKSELFDLLPGVCPLARETLPIESTTVLKTVQTVSRKTVLKTDLKLMALLRENPASTIPALAEQLGLSRRGIKWQLAKLKAQGRLRRVGPDKGGHWEVPG